MVEIRIDAAPPGGRVHLHVSGELDLVSAPHLDQAVRRHDEFRSATFVVHLTAVTFADSSAIDCLVRLHHHLGDRLVLCAPSDRVRRVLEISGVVPLFRIEDPN